CLMLDPVAPSLYPLSLHDALPILPPSGNDPHSFLNVISTALRQRRAGQGNAGAMVAWGGVTAAAAMLVLWALDAVGAGVPWPDAFGFVITACLALGVLIAFGGWGASLQLERARGLHPDAAVDGVRAVLRILIVFALVTPFWSLFDQKASTWIIQGNAMVIPHDQWWWPSWLILEPAQMQAL